MIEMESKIIVDGCGAFNILNNQEAFLLEKENCVLAQAQKINIDEYRLVDSCSISEINGACDNYIVQELESLSIESIELDDLVDILAGTGGVGCKDASCAGSCQTHF